MTMNPLPPQAYTKETMLKAYQWLMSQNSSIREMATTPDILVSLYLKATRDGDSALERPSIQNFKKELKSLAGMMGELDRPIQPFLTPQPLAATPAAQTAPASTPTPTPAPLTAHQESLAPQVVSQVQIPMAERSASAIELLDTYTQEMIREVKADFNLSSDSEALRMLIKIGFARAKSLLRT